ncbi:hypothetical protein SAMN04489731_1264 [Amycolatopsis regifaucium]|nr:hypothetical protein SAMN04489731_1264 [Amycolatopsis regifaucium]
MSCSPIFRAGWMLQVFNYGLKPLKGATIWAFRLRMEIF